MHHILKIEEPFFDAKVAGLKLFEIRYNGDRGFQKGDTVSYRVLFNDHHWTDPKGLYEITYVTAFKQQPDYVVFGEKCLEKETEHE